MVSFPSHIALRAEAAEWMQTAAECLSFCLFGMVDSPPRPNPRGSAE